MTAGRRGRSRGDRRWRGWPSRRLGLVVLALAAITLATGRWAAAAPVAAAPAQVERVRYEADGRSTRVIVMLSRAVPHEVRVLPGDPRRGSRQRLVVDFSNARLGSAARVPIGAEHGILQGIRTGQFTARTARVVLDLAGESTHVVRAAGNPPRVVIDVAARPGVVLARPPVSAPAPRAPAVASAVAPPPVVSPPQPQPVEPAVPAPPERAKPAAPPPAPAQSHPGPRPPAAGEPEVLVNVPMAPPAPIVADGARAGMALETEDLGRAPAVRPPAPVAVAPTPVPPDAVPEQAPVEVAAAANAADRERAPARSHRIVLPPIESVGTPWRIVLDPGHGGNDPGARGVDGLLEKAVTLTIARRVKERLEEELNATVLLTRDGDQTRSLADRTAFANASRADLFISIHANADDAGRLQGIETYTLNNSNDRATIRLAKMENGPQLRIGRGDLSFILSDMVQSSKEEESIGLAEHLHSRVLARLRARYPDVRNLGVKKGPFYVLVGAYMPCVLIETSFLTHPVEGKRLASEEYQADIAEGVYLGIRDFLSDARLAKTL